MRVSLGLGSSKRVWSRFVAGLACCCVDCLDGLRPSSWLWIGWSYPLENGSRLRVLRASAPFTSDRCNLSCAGIGRVCGVVGARRWLCGGFGWSSMLDVCLSACYFSWGGWLLFLGAGFGVPFFVLLVLIFFLSSFLLHGVFFCLFLVSLALLVP